MILIFSIQGDGSTSDVIDWLASKSIDFIRINIDDKDLVKTQVEICDEGSAITLLYKNRAFKLDEIKGVWYRRGGYFKFYNSINWSSLEVSNTIKNELRTDLWNESKTVATFVYQYLENKNSINSFFTSNPNKLFLLETAASCGLKVPKTLITSSKSDLRKFINTSPNGVVTKGINESLHFGDDEGFYSVYTEVISNLNDIPESFFLSKFQEKVNKVFEIRVFYFFEEFYSMAIFSQKNEQTSVDFRKYDEKKPNRCVPYELPNQEKTKIIKLMNRMNLNSGSLDLIYNDKGEFVFLEINPIGQFSMTSVPCNYNLEKIIAEKLIEYERCN